MSELLVVPVSEFLVDWCSQAAAAFSCERFHYSRTMPVGPTIRLGVWESDRFIGAVIFSRGASPHLGTNYGLSQAEVCELTRVALSVHQAPVSQIVARAISMLKRRCPGLRLIVSFADPNHNHVGVIYQALGFIYAGASAPAQAFVDRTGRRWHRRQVSKTGWGTEFGSRVRVPRVDDCKIVPLLGKHRYLYPLDKSMRRRVLPLSLPYPRRQGLESETPAPRAGSAGATPAVGSLRSS